ncbi:MAG TPA: cupin domain-containing protein [Candidatus Paceibacterota bacterium]
MNDKKTNHVNVELFPIETWPRVWGEEVLLGHSKGKYTLKMLKMKAGTKGGFQKHRVKDETGYLYSGTMILRFDKGDSKVSEMTLKAGQSIYIPPGAVHQEEAITDCVIFEASNPVFDDRVRMEEEYGMKMDGGLPTTEHPRVE